MKKTNAHAILNQLLFHATFFMCLVGVVGFGVVMLRHHIAVTANSTKQLEYELVQVKRDLAEVAADIARDGDPAVLKAKNIELGLGLQPPAERFVVRIDESPEERLAAKRNIQRFATEAAAGVVAVRFQVVDRGSR